MRIRWITGFLDTPSRVAEPFWLAVTGTTLSARRDGGVFATLVPAAGDACLRVQVTGAGRPGAHLDLHVDQVPAAASEAVRFGATVVVDTADLVVLRSPAGIAFCLVPWHGEAVRPAPVTWAGGQSSTVDQLSLDIPGRAYEGEVAFWASLTGWAPVRSDHPEFGFLSGGPAMPLRLLLQRLGDGAPGVHLDLACDGVDLEVDRHVALGATVVRRVAGEWTTLRDPAGREYCVTGRPPVLS
ncbi:VOC family protein [Actinoplanes sp. CA-030573]|uniref:VOC family protein n=1 Tax=Actinoplanes sp. CA-030573 TaxID=3239898 RepID=UPI003D9485B5